MRSQKAREISIFSKKAIFNKIAICNETERYSPKEAVLFVESVESLFNFQIIFLVFLFALQNQRNQIEVDTIYLP